MRKRCCAGTPSEKDSWASTEPPARALRAAIVALAAVMPAFGLPDAGLALILGVDHLLDMGRTATNVLGNALATAMVSRWGGPRRQLRE